ncbi:MAG: hypothetical protein A2Y34_06495 [Spirochaetes bacterium GWC1_27_15]|nr:MAG: hypothetical protein A2Z98_07340 [Spirochaetes bacterium GWB1_27_13]OHD21307.1 MAG: hypothetical protein A2Y34_06495 [Spirochaetes bacterium GWC1_27_15]
MKKIKKYIVLVFLFVILHLYSAIDVKDYKNDNEKIKSFVDKEMFGEAAFLYLKWGNIFEKENMFKESMLSYSASAKCFEKAYNMKQSIEYYLKSINLYDKLKKEDKNKYIEQKYKWITNLGFLELYYNQNIESANKYFYESEEFFTSSNMIEELAFVKKGKGFICKLQGDYNGALFFLNEAANTLKDINKTEYINILNEIVDIYVNMKDITLNTQQILKYEEEILLSSDKEIISRYYLIRTQISKNPEEKIKLLEICLNQIGNQEKNIPFKIKALISYGEIFLNTNPTLSIDKFSEAYTLSQSINDERSIFNLNNLFSIAYFNQKNYEKSLEYLNKSLTMKNYNPNDREKAFIFINTGISYYNLKDYKSAIDNLTKSINIVEKIRNYTNPYDEKNKSFFYNTEQAYRFLTLSFIEEKKFRDAFNIYEKSRSRSFLNSLSIKNALQKVNVAKAEVKNYTNLTNKINFLSQKIDNCLNIIEIISLQEQLNKINKDLDEFTLSIESKYKEFKNFKNPKILQFDDIEKLLGEKDVFLMFFVSEKNYVFIAKKGQKEPKVIKLDENIDNYAELLNNSLYYSYKIDSDSYLAGINSLFTQGKIDLTLLNNNANIKTRGVILERNKSKQSKDEVMDSIKNLYGYFAERLFTKEIQDELKNTQNIYFCPDGNLWTMPIESIIVKDFRKNNSYYLGDKYNLTYIQSLSALNLLKNKTNSLNTKSYDLIAFGGASYPFYLSKDTNDNKKFIRKNPMTENDLSFMVKDIPLEYRKKEEGRNLSNYYNQKILNWVDLPFSKNEIMIANGIFPNNKSFIGSLVSEEKIKFLSETEELKKANIILFSVHGYIEKENPLMSSLVLSLPEKINEQDLNNYGIVDDGYLNSNEIINLKLDNNFVILSACETGKGKIEGGEGLAGLSQSFMLAGASSVLVTLWSIGDESTQTFIKIFLNKIKTGIPHHKALRETKKEYREKYPKYAAPFYWSPFVLYGAM